MTLKNDKKYEVELTCRIKIDIRNFDGILLLKQKMCQLTIYRGVMCHDN